MQPATLMGEPKGKLTSGSICCFGVSHVGVPVATVMAHMCPNLNVVVVDMNSERITLWNTKQIPSREPKVEEMLKKSQNRNLMFSTNTVGSVKEADIILISNASPIHDRAGKVLDLTDIEETTRLIAKVSESDKIVVVKSTVPVGTNETLSRILLANKANNVTFQVLSAPEFFSAGNAISSLLHPDKVLLGSDMSEEALRAAEKLASLYTCWIPREKIIRVNSKSAELAKLGENAFLAQRLSNVSALSIICEKSGADVTDVVKMVGKCSDVGSECLEPSLGFGGTPLKKDLTYLVRLCEDLNLPESADYWSQVLLMNEYHEKRFYRRILSCFYNTLSHKKIAVWGLGFKRNVETTNDSLAIDICLSLLEEGAKLSLCDPKVEQRQVMNDLKAGGMTDSKAVAYFDDPYKAARKTDAIIILTDWDELKTLDYNLIYKDMLRPAHIFDGRKCLPHEELMKIGFVVKTIGKEFVGFSENISY